MIRVLIAEDNDTLREALAESIRAAGDMAVAGCAATGRELARLALEEEFDVLLADIEMETARAGITAVEAILKQKPGSRVIFLSIHENDEIIATAMGCGAVDYIFKGSPEEEMLRHIRAAFNGAPIMHERIRSTVMQEYSRLRKSEESLLFFINNISRLTGAEIELVRYLLKGYSTAEIARLRVVEVVTVKTQIKGLLRKFHCGRTREIVELIRDMKLERLFEK